MTDIQANARELLIAHISRFATYHGQKETMTWGAATLYVVAVSIVVHGISVTPLMNLYTRRKARRDQKAATSTSPVGP